jgi:hypothetical protein
MIMKYMADRSKFGRKVKKVNKKPEVIAPKYIRYICPQRPNDRRFCDNIDSSRF